jgi:glycosyltransferase involved in cell wall biosynthesis
LLQAKVRLVEAMTKPPITPNAAPRVSVVMAAYNYGQYIAQAIQSVIDQTFTDWELIVVDDGSTDDTCEVVQQFLSDSRIHYHRQENRGQPQAKNEGIKLSRGSLVAFLDADDAWLPTKLEKQIILFRQDPNLGVAYTSLYFMDPTGMIMFREKREMVRGDVLQKTLIRNVSPFCSSIVRREVFDDVGLFDESIPLAIDYELWLRVALKYCFDYVDEPLLLYRTGHANLSRRSVERRQLVLDRILPGFLAREGVAERLGKRTIAEAYADTYINQALDVRALSLPRALKYHLKAIRTAPWMWNAWRSLARFGVPDSIWANLKRLLRGAHYSNAVAFDTTHEVPSSNRVEPSVDQRAKIC